MKVLEVKPLSPEWHEVRAESWTASTGACLVAREAALALQAHAASNGVELNVAPLLAVGLETYYETPWSTWAQKVGRIPRFQGNAHTERGRANEDKILAAFESQEFMLVQREVTATAAAYPWLLASFDGLAPASSDDSVASPHGFPVEVKCPAFQSRKKLWDSKKAGRLAIMGLPYYWVQVQHQLLVAEAPYGWFVAAGVEKDAEGIERLIFPLQEKVPRDDEFLKAYLAIAKYYHENFIEKMEEPPKLASDEKLLSDLEAKADFALALTESDPSEAVDLYLAAVKAEEEAAERRKELEKALLAAAEKQREEGSDLVVLADKLQVTFGKSTSVSWQKVATALGKDAGGIPEELLKSYTSERQTVKLKAVAV